MRSTNCFYLKPAQLVFVFCMLLFALNSQAQVATAGDYRSAGTGNWSAPATWQVRDAVGSWTTAAAAPTAANNVYVQSGHSVTMDIATGDCKDLHLQTNAVLAINNNILQISGKIRSYNSYPTTNGVLTSNVATLTTSAAHGFNVGQEVIVTGLAGTLSPLNGTYTITATTATTFSYSVTNADIVTTSSGTTEGSVTAGNNAVVTGVDANFYLAQFNSTSVNRTMCTTTNGGTGLLKFIGTSRNITNTGEWTTNSIYFPTDVSFSLTGGNTGSLNTIFGGRTVTFNSGIVSTSFRITANNNTTGTGVVTIKSGATLISAASSSSQIICRTSSASIASFVIESGAVLELSGSSPIIDALSITNLGLVNYSRPSSQTLLAKGADINSVNPSNYYDIKLSGSGTRQVPVFDVVVANSFIAEGSSISNSTNNTKFLIMANGSTIYRNVVAAAISSSATVKIGTTPTDKVNIVINATVTGANELHSSPTPGTYGTLTVAAGQTYTVTGGRAVTDVVNNGKLSFAPSSSTLTFTISGNVSGTGLFSVAATFEDKTSLTFNGTGPAGIIYIDQLVPGSSNAFNQLSLNRTGAGNVIVSGDVSFAGNVSLTAGTLTFGANTITIKGAVNGTGSITGSSVSNLVIGGAATTINFTAGSSLKNLTLSSSTASATLGTDLDIYGIIKLNDGTLNINGKNLVLKSNAANTAAIDQLKADGSNLIGATNVTVERYIKLRAGGDGRAYRLLTPSVNTSGTIQANWMETGMNSAIGTNVDPLPGYGTQISGSGGNANGFDKTASNAASLYATANGTTPTYTAIGAVNSGTMNAKTGYFLYLRGDRNQDMTLPLAPNMPTSSTTLRAKGTLLTGTQTTFTNAYTGGGAWNLVTNPYASPIDWSLVQPASSGITGSYIYWDANIGTRGGFATVTTAGVSTPATSATQIIQSGQAFFVESDNIAPTPSVSIQESHKVAGNNNDVFIVAPPAVESFRTELYFTESNGYRRIADGAIALYNNSYSAALDTKDTKEINNWDENIAIARDGKHLAIESRPVIDKSDDLPIFMNNMKKQGYEFEFTPSVFTNTALKAELIDNYLGTRTLLSVTDPTVVSFTITNDAASSATDRFKVVFGSFGNPTGVDAITIKASQQNSGVQVNWSSKTETDMVRYEVEKSTYGTSFTKANTTTAFGNSSVPVNYNWFDANPNMGTNFYRIKGTDKAGNVRYSDMVRVLFGKGEPSIVVYPNPLQGTTFKIDMYNLVKGSYVLNLYNNMGQLVYTEQLQHDGSQATRTINLKGEIAKGAYQLQLSGGNGFKTTRSITKN